jgi:hypothetical protein
LIYFVQISIFIIEETCSRIFVLRLVTCFHPRLERCVEIRLTLFIKSILVIPTKTRKHDRNSPVIVLECSKFPYPYGNAAVLCYAPLCCAQLTRQISSCNYQRFVLRIVRDSGKKDQLPFSRKITKRLQ